MSGQTKTQGPQQVLKGDQMSFAKEMKKLINNKDMSDIKFLIGPQRKPVLAHRCILAGRCQVFKAMFAEQAPKGKQDDVPFVLADMSPEIFLSLLEYIYTNTVTLTNATVIDVLGTAIEYGLDELKKLCVSYLAHNMSTENVCDAMQAGVTYGESDLQTTSLRYIEENSKDVFKSKFLHELSEAALSSILKTDHLLLDEADVLQSVREWATVNSVVLNQPVSKVARNIIQHVRLPLLSPAELAQVEKDNTKDKIISMEMLSFAWKCHALKRGEKSNPWTTVRKGTRPRECHGYLTTYA